MRSIVSLQPGFRPTATRRSSVGSGLLFLGIGFYSLTKMGGLPAFAIPRGWTCFALWTAGNTMRWFEGVVGWQWRVLLPLSALFELAAFLLFFRTVSRHRPRLWPVGLHNVAQTRAVDADGDRLDARVSGDAGSRTSLRLCKSP